MDRFEGFTEDDFLFFIRRDEKRRIILKNNMKTLRRAILVNLPSDLSKRLRFGRVGLLRKNDWGCWGAISEYKKFQDFAHFTLSFSVDGFELWLNVETSSAINRLKKNLDSDPVTFFNLIKELPFYVLRVYEKEPTGYFARDWPWIPIFESQCEYIDVASTIFLYEKIKELSYPVFRVGWIFDVRSEHDRNTLMSVALVDEVVKLITELIPLHDFINRT